MTNISKEKISFQIYILSSSKAFFFVLQLDVMCAHINCVPTQKRAILATSPILSKRQVEEVSVEIGAIGRYEASGAYPCHTTAPASSYSFLR